jgi:hypothetical protein
MNLLGDEKMTDKVCRNAIVGRREGMPIEQLLQMPAVRTDRFSITGFAMYSTLQYTTVQYSTVQNSAVE